MGIYIIKRIFFMIPILIGITLISFFVIHLAPGWGGMLSRGKTYIMVAWWLTLFPGIAILLTVLSFNLVGEAVRNALDPRYSSEK